MKFRWRLWRADPPPPAGLLERVEQLLGRMEGLGATYAALAADCEYQRARATQAENRYTESRYYANKALEEVWWLAERVARMEARAVEIRVRNPPGSARAKNVLKRRRTS